MFRLEHLRHKSVSLLAACALSFAPVAHLNAQQSSTNSMSQMHSAPQAMVDGATHPELVPDSTAYRLVFVVLGLPANASAADKQLQMLRLSHVGLNTADTQAAVQALELFNSQYTSIIKNFNDATHLAVMNGGAPDVAGFALMRDGLVQATRDQLKQALSPQAMAALDSFVQQEKTRMRVPANVAAP